MTQIYRTNLKHFCVTFDFKHCMFFQQAKISKKYKEKDKNHCKIVKIKLAKINKMKVKKIPKLLVVKKIHFK